MPSAENPGLHILGKICIAIKASIYTMASIIQCVNGDTEGLDNLPTNDITCQYQNPFLHPLFNKV